MNPVTWVGGTIGAITRQRDMGHTLGRQPRKWLRELDSKGIDRSGQREGDTTGGVRWLGRTAVLAGVAGLATYGVARVSDRPTNIAHRAWGNLTHLGHQAWGEIGDVAGEATGNNLVMGATLGAVALVGLGLAMRNDRVRAAVVGRRGDPLIPRSMTWATRKGRAVEAAYQAGTVGKAKRVGGFALYAAGAVTTAAGATLMWRGAFRKR